MGNPTESKDWSTLAVANTTDHMLTINEENSKQLLLSATEIKYTEIFSQVFLRSTLPTLQKLIALSCSNAKTSKILVQKVNELVAEVCEPPNRYYHDLAQSIFTQVIQAINNAIWGAGAMKEGSFLNVLVTSLSNVNLVSQKTMVPNKVLEMLKKFEDDDD
jgi:hypothetical protein